MPRTPGRPMDPTLRIGTRASPLALWQANFVRDAVQSHHGDLTLELECIRTSGDQDQDRELAEIGIGVFSKELDHALLAGQVQFVVHSLKDLPTELDDELCIAAVPERASPVDAWVSRNKVALEDLPQGARVGTSSPRRKAQLLHHREDLEILPIRGNVDTRIRKEYDGTILAHAGLLRLGRLEAIHSLIPVDLILPAVSQGAIAVVARRSDEDVLEKLRLIDHPPSRTRIEAERSFLRTLRGGCQVPAAALAEFSEEEEKDVKIHIRGRVGTLDGKRLIEGEIEGPTDEAERLGESLAKDLLGRGGASILDELRHE